MTTAGARALRDEEQDMTREAVLLQWERKIEAAERRTGRFERVAVAPAPGEPERDEPEPGSVATLPEPRRFEVAAPRAVEPAPVVPLAERRTITITGRPGGPPRRRPNVAERQLARPDRIALWAFILGLFLVAVAAGTAYA